MALVPFPGLGPKPDVPAHDLDPDPDFSTAGNRALRRERTPASPPDDEEAGEAKMSFL